MFVFLFGRLRKSGRAEVILINVYDFEKDIDVSKIFKTAWREIWSLLSVEVNVKPVRCFDLKTQSNDIFPFLFRNVDQETAGKQLIHC